MEIFEHALGIPLVFLFEFILLFILNHERSHNKESKDCVKYVGFGKIVSLVLLIICNVLVVLVTILLISKTENYSIWVYVVIYAMAVFGIFMGSFVFALTKNFRIYVFDDHLVKCNFRKKVTEYPFDDIIITIKEVRGYYGNKLLKVTIRTKNDNKKIFAGYTGHSIMNVERILEKFSQWLKK